MLIYGVKPWTCLETMFGHEINKLWQDIKSEKSEKNSHYGLVWKTKRKTKRKSKLQAVLNGLLHTHHKEQLLYVSRSQL